MGAGGMAASGSAASVLGDASSQIHREGTAWQPRMREEMAEIKPGQLALEGAEAQRDLLQDIFCCLWMSLWEEPTLIRSTCMQDETEVFFYPPAL